MLFTQISPQNYFHWCLSSLQTDTVFVASLLFLLLHHHRTCAADAQVLGGWSPGPLDVLRARMERVDFQEVNIPMPPSGCALARLVWASVGGGRREI